MECGPDLFPGPAANAKLRAASLALVLSGQRFYQIDSHLVADRPGAEGEGSILQGDGGAVGQLRAGPDDAIAFADLQPQLALHVRPVAGDGGQGKG